MILRITDLLARAIGSLPLGLGARLANALGPVAYALARGQRRRAEANLRLAWPEQSDDWVRRMVVDAFRNRLLTAFELMRFARHGAGGLPPIEWRGRDRLRAELGRDSGVMLLSGHLGNYWLIPISLSAQGDRTSMLATLAPPTGPFTVRGIFRTYLYRRLLPRAGVAIVDTSSGSREAMSERLGAGDLLFVMADLPVGRVVEGRLLDAEHPLPVGPAEVAGSAGAVVSPVMTHRRPDGSHEISVEPELALDGGPERAMQSYLALLERHVRSAPAQWHWFHRHWQAAERAPSP
jgi:KDO2-lipid IV(A) lauroyltransferase